MPSESSTPADTRLSARGTARRRRLKARVDTRAASVVVGILTAAGLLAITLCQWRMLRAPSWDLGIFTQLLDSYAHGRAPIGTIRGEGFNLLGDHFHPLLVILTPIYWLFPSPLTLVVVQDLIFALSAAAFTWRVRPLVPWWAAAGGGLVIGLGWGTQGAVATEFHEVALAVPLLVFALTAFLRRQWWSAALWAAPLVWVKEDLGLTVAALGCAILWRRWREDDDASASVSARWPALNHWWSPGAALIIWGVAWTALAVTVILPAFNTGGDYEYSSNLTLTLGHFFTPFSKWVLVLLLALTAGGFGLTSPLMMVTLPTLLWRFAGNNPYYTWIGWHYDVVLMPIAVAALVDATRERSPLLQRWMMPWRATLGLGLSAAILTTVVLAGQLPMTKTRCDLDAAWGDTTPRVRQQTAAQIMETIAATPIGERDRTTTAGTTGKPTVATDMTLMARLVPTAQVYWLTEKSVPPQFVVLDRFSGAMRNHFPQQPDEWASKRYGMTYRTVVAENGFFLLQRVEGND